MTEPLSRTDIEIIRRSLVMSPTLPAPAAECLLTDIQRLRELLETVDSDLRRSRLVFAGLGATSLESDRPP